MASVNWVILPHLLAPVDDKIPIIYKYAYSAIASICCCRLSLQCIIHQKLHHTAILISKGMCSNFQGALCICSIMDVNGCGSARVYVYLAGVTYVSNILPFWRERRFDDWSRIKWRRRSLFRRTTL